MLKNKRFWQTLAVLFAFEVVLSDIVYRAVEGVDTPKDIPESCGVLVLGTAARPDGSPSSAQRLRVEVGARAYDEFDCSLMVFSGGAVGNRFVEAEGMAAIARDLKIPEQDIRIDARARSTWENVGCATEKLEAYDHILIASDSLHAQRAKRYFCKQRPDLCERVFSVGARPGIGFTFSKIVGMHYEALAWLRDRLVYDGGLSEDAPACGIAPTGSIES